MDVCHFHFLCYWNECIYSNGFRTGVWRQLFYNLNACNHICKPWFSNDIVSHGEKITNIILHSLLQKQLSKWQAGRFRAINGTVDNTSYRFIMCEHRQLTSRRRAWNQPLALISREICKKSHFFLSSFSIFPSILSDSQNLILGQIFFFLYYYLTIFIWCTKGW